MNRFVYMYMQCYNEYIHECMRYISIWYLCMNSRYKFAMMLVSNLYILQYIEIYSYVYVCMCIYSLVKATSSNFVKSFFQSINARQKVCLVFAFSIFTFHHHLLFFPSIYSQYLVFNRLVYIFNNFESFWLAVFSGYNNYFHYFHSPCTILHV